MWIITALVEDFDVTVYTRGGFDLATLNELAGTRLATSSFTLRLAAVETRLRIGAIAAGAFVRSLAQAGTGFDLRVTASGAWPWGSRALHFLSSVDWNPVLAGRIPGTPVVSLRGRLSRVLLALASGPRRSFDGHFFVANSEWLRRQSAPYCPGEMRVIHPVVPEKPAGRDWQTRENIVLVFGRISPEKRIESCIRIVETARARGFAGHLVIAGPDGEARYANQIRGMAASRDWIEMRPGLSRSDKEDLLGRVKYGLNACCIEAFGISTGEMAASGAIVLVPAGTGQDEIVTNPAQRYETEEDAAARLVQLGRNPGLQARLHAEALADRTRFTPERFVAAVRATARDVLCPKTVSGLE